MALPNITKHALQNARGAIRFLKDRKEYTGFRNKRKTNMATLTAHFAMSMMLVTDEEKKEATETTTETLRQYGIMDNTTQQKILDELKQYGKTINAFAYTAADKSMTHAHETRQMKLYDAIKRNFIRKIILTAYTQSQRIKKTIDKYNKNIYKNIKTL